MAEEDTVMVDERLVAKYDHRFGIYDTDRDGFIGETDFTARVERLLEGLGLSAGSPKAAAGYAASRSCWQQIADRAGIAHHKPLDRQGFVAALSSAGADGTIMRIFEPVIAAHVNLVDTDDDGVVDRSEFVRAQAVEGIPADRAEEAFHRIDSDGDGSITLAEWLAAVSTFHTDPEPDSPGDRVVGYRP
ncbi:EF-hand domain-containing protein [Streptomyces aureoversilis]|uniref:EF-hand domain-containing protein n=1 Tax=Streptomyces aureoversilis TaxID=67277 RepID=A0ABW0A3K3_9ACTN